MLTEDGAMEDAVPARLKVRTMRQPAQRAADRGHRKVRTDPDKETRVVQANVQNDGRCGPEPMCPGVLGDPDRPSQATMSFAKHACASQATVRP